MSRTLYHYYERELTFIRQLAQDFAKQYPAAAGRLLVEANRSTDPHIERLIESFALLTGRIQNKLDDEFPELTSALLGVLYPHYLAPIPSMAIVQFGLDRERAQLPEGFLIDRKSRLSVRPIGDQQCKYRTGYPVTLWPVQLAGARFMKPPFPRGLTPPRGTVAALRLQLACMGDLTFDKLELDSLRFFLTGEHETIAILYEALFNHVLQAVFFSPDNVARPSAIIIEPQDCLAQVGFELEDGLLPYPRQSFLGYRLLSEFFAFPARFLFVDLRGLKRVCRSGFQERVDVVLFFNRGSSKLEQDISADTFRLGCTPIVNVFEQTAEPIPLSHSRFEYRIIPDVASPDGMEVYSVDSVTSVDPVTSVQTEYQPFYSFRHTIGEADEEVRTFWYASRRPSLRPRDRGTEVYLSLVDLDFDPRLPSDPVLVVRTTCTNRELPVMLREAGDRIPFDLELAAPVSQVLCVHSPTNPLRPPLRRGTYWRVISHLSLNHLSLSASPDGLEAFKEILRVYDFSDPEFDKQTALVTQQLIDGITGMASRKVTGRIASPHGMSFCRGTEVRLEFDDEKYVGTGVYLFASALERFLGLYTSLNSFTQLIAKTKLGERPFKIWPPRAGAQQLI
jgi:type VI secretion system protein ImpG